MTLRFSDVKSALDPYYRGLNQTHYEQINQYIDLLQHWNRKISLTTVDSLNGILRFHFGESIFALNLCDFTSGRLADVGSGAGFPGLALKIFCPELDVVLIEPNLKKSAFLAEVVRSLNLASINILSKRFEQSSIEAGSLQFVTCRALAQSQRLISWSSSAISMGGSLVLWLSTEAVAELQKQSEFKWKEPKVIPGSKRRAILIGHKQA